MTRKITQGDRRSLRRIIRKHIVRSDHDFGMLRTEYIERVEVDNMAADLVEWADRRALRTSPAPAPSATREEVGEALHPGLFSLADYEYARRFDNHGAGARAQHQEAVLADEVDPLLARYDMTRKVDRCTPSGPTPTR